MFDRKKYKQFAKTQLKGRWPTPLLMTLITFLILILLQAHELRDFLQELSEFTITADEPLIMTETISYSTASIETLRTWIAILVEFILIFAQVNVYITLSKGPEPVGLTKFIEGLGLWGKAILAGLWNTLWILLWSLLFIIPGIVKFYAYSQMFYLLAEFPKLPVAKAMRISIAITRGHKADLFMMHLSFIGWAILASIPAGIGYIWLLPYVNMSMTNAYHALLKEALSTGIIKAEDLTSRQNSDF